MIFPVVFVYMVCMSLFLLHVQPVTSAVTSGGKKTKQPRIFSFSQRTLSPTEKPPNTITKPTQQRTLPAANVPLVSSQNGPHKTANTHLSTQQRPRAAANVQLSSQIGPHSAENTKLSSQQRPPEPAKKPVRMCSYCHVNTVEYLCSWCHIQGYCTQKCQVQTNRAEEPLFSLI